MKKTIVLIISLFLMPSISNSQNTKLDKLNDKYYKVYDKGKYTQALKIARKSLIYSKKKFGDKSIEYANSLGLLGNYYLDLGEYSLAEVNLNNALFTFNNLKINSTEDYANNYNSLGILYKNIGNYEKSQQCYLIALNIFDKLFGENNDYSGMVYNNLGILNRYSGNYQKSEFYSLKGAEIYKKYYGEESYYYSTVLNNLGNLYTDLNNTSKAKKCFLLSAEIRKKIYGENSAYYAQVMNNLGNLYLCIGQDSNALNCYQISEKIYKQIYGENSFYYASVLNNLGIISKNQGDFKNAEKLYLETLKIRKQILGEKHPEVASCYYNLGVLYDLMGNDLKAEQFYLMALNLQEEILGTNSPDYAISIDALGHFYYNHNNFEKTEKYWIELNQILNHQIESNFKFLTETEKEKFTSTYLDYFDNISSFIFKYKNPKLYEVLYDNELAHKGMILNSTLAFNEIIDKSTDSIVKSAFSELIGIKQVLSKMYSMPIAERYFNTDSLEEQANDIEKKLNIRLSFLDINQSTINNKLTWKNVQNSLNYDEAAIEFLNFKYLTKSKTDSILYCALVITKEMEKPQLIFLFEQKQLKLLLFRNPEFNNNYNPEYSYIAKIYSHSSKTSDSLYNLIWKPFDSILVGIKKVYISPSGLLNKIAFDALTNSSQTILSDKYQISYLSTTTNIINHKNLYIKDIKNAAIFGGITYDEDTALMKYVSIPKTVADLDTSKVNYWLKNKTAMPQMWKYLPGSLTEAICIDSVFKSNSKKTTFNSNYFATEELFKSFSTNSPDLIHLATHGFYFENDSSNNYYFNKNLQYVFSDNPLMRSGILLSGGNYVWIYSNLPLIVEDGVLTAYEISHLALFNTKLVVLSACQTGLGDLKGSEGVYGLCRAFKMAGVDYIIMSLWTVPDIQTKELMTEFYKNFITGQEVRTAFRTAQDFMKNKYKNIPGAAYAWAAFVLIE